MYIEYEGLRDLCSEQILKNFWKKLYWLSYKHSYLENTPGFFLPNDKVKHYIL